MTFQFVGPLQTFFAGPLILKLNRRTGEVWLSDALDKKAAETEFDGDARKWLFSLRWFTVAPPVSVPASARGLRFEFLLVDEYQTLDQSFPVIVLLDTKTNSTFTLMDKAGNWIRGDSWEKAQPKWRVVEFEADGVFSQKAPFPPSLTKRPHFLVAGPFVFDRRNADGYVVTGTNDGAHPLVWKKLPQLPRLKKNSGLTFFPITRYMYHPNDVSAFSRKGIFPSLVFPDMRDSALAVVVVDVSNRQVHMLHGRNGTDYLKGVTFSDLAWLSIKTDADLAAELNVAAPFVLPAHQNSAEPIAGRGAFSAGLIAGLASPVSGKVWILDYRFREFRLMRDD